MLLHRNKGVEFLADLISEALAAPSLDRTAVITIIATQVDHGFCVVAPVILQRLKALEPIDLLRVIADQLLQTVQLRNDLRPGHFIRVQKMLITGDQVTAHAGFQVNRQLHRFIGVADHPVRMLEPLND